MYVMYTLKIYINNSKLDKDLCKNVNTFAVKFNYNNKAHEVFYENKFSRFF